MTPQRMMERLFPEGHTYKVAFYPAVVELDRYTTEGEWIGAGYTAGGESLSGYRDSRLPLCERIAQRRSVERCARRRIAYRRPVLWLQDAHFRR